LGSADSDIGRRKRYSVKLCRNLRYRRTAVGVARTTLRRASRRRLRLPRRDLGVRCAASRPGDGRRAHTDAMPHAHRTCADTRCAMWRSGETREMHMQMRDGGVGKRQRGPNAKTRLGLTSALTGHHVPRAGPRAPPTPEPRAPDRSGRRS
jgi:hypothetical protein